MSEKPKSKKARMLRVRAALLQAQEALTEALKELNLPSNTDDPELDAEEWLHAVEGDPAGFDLGGER